MDNISHSVVGLALARSGLNRVADHATMVLLLAANAPDIDIVVAPWGALRYLEAHRGYTHCLLGLPFMAAVTVAVTAALFRHRLHWLRLWLVALIGVASHLFLDCTNAYGIRLLLPFSSGWSHLDWNSLTDGVLLPAFIIAALWPWFANLVSSEMGARSSRGRGSAIAALAFTIAFECLRAVLHMRATEQLTARLYQGAPPLAVAALPSAWSPFRWLGIVESENMYRSFDLDSSQNLEMSEARVVYKIRMDAAIKRARATEAFRYFEYFARFPVWSELPIAGTGGEDTRVDLTDLRFGAPGVGSFHSIALIDSRLRVLESKFTFGSGTNMGWGKVQQQP